MREGADISVSDAGEFGLIARITDRLPQGAMVVLGPGDDAAVVVAPDGRVVATTDLLVDGVHFRRDWSTAYDIGRKAAAQNLADVAAVGARPTALLVGLATPGDVALAWLDGFADGLRDECAVVEASVVGGDVVQSDRLTVAVTALGDLGGRAPVTRSGAQVGDVVVVVGRLGFAAAGLALVRAGDVDAPLVEAHRRPQVPYDAALGLAEAGATSMIDVSDGLVADLGHISERSGVAIEVVAADLPVAPEISAAAHGLGVDPLTWVAGGGDDHAIVATLPADAVTRSSLEPLRMHVIGRVVEGRGVRFADGAPPGVHGHEHFRAP